ncbi:PIG-L family deacetylase [soil metagenome]
MIVAEIFNWQRHRKWRRVNLCAVTCALICAASFSFNSASSADVKSSTEIRTDTEIKTDTELKSTALVRPTAGMKAAAGMKFDSPITILHELKRFRQMGSALYIAAHPDDENTELLAYLALGRNYRTAYLSLTRGDGGQNVLGSDLGAKLGVARTQELLAARKIDGAQQFFSRAVDFGFSKNYVETLNVWDKKAVLSDIVRIIRQFRPDILITRFSPKPGGTHGHHTASTVLAMEAFKLAGDPKAFPELGLPPWQPKRIMWNTSIWQRDKISPGDLLKIDAGGKDLVTGQSFTELAEFSRGMHKTQGFDQFKMPGANNPARIESFQLLDGASASSDIMDGVDTSWHRVQGGDHIAKLSDEIVSQFDLKDVSASLPDLLKLRSQLAKLPHSETLEAVVEEKKAQLDRIILACLGLEVETTIAQSDVVPGEPITLHHSAVVHAKLPSHVAVRLKAVRYPSIKKEVEQNVDLKTNQIHKWEAVETLPINSLLAHPWWLRVEGSAGMFEVGDPKLIGTAENSPAFPIEALFEISGQPFIVHDQPVQVETSTAGVRKFRPLDIIAPVSLQCSVETLVFTPGTSKTIAVEITAARANSRGTLKLEGPSDWKVSPASQALDLDKVGVSAKYTFTVSAPTQASAAKLVAIADINGVQYKSRREEVNYAHIPTQVLHAPSAVRAVSLDLITRGQAVGFLPGAGELLPENLQQMGYTVKVLDEADLTEAKLRGLDAIILGVRALNVRKNIDAAMPQLFEYVKGGGTVITQYNRPDKMTTDKIAPYSMHISSGRVTDEKSTVTFLAPESPVLNIPNKITSADFDGWVQERGLYFADKWDKNFVPIIACSDAGEEPLKGGLLVAQYGKGHFVYTGLSLFRQLPAGVPGAYRLLANMIALSK